MGRNGQSAGSRGGEDGGRQREGRRRGWNRRRCLCQGDHTHITTVARYHACNHACNHARNHVCNHVCNHACNHACKSHSLRLTLSWRGSAGNRQFLSEPRGGRRGGWQGETWRRPGGSWQGQRLGKTRREAGAGGAWRESQYPTPAAGQGQPPAPWI